MPIIYLRFKMYRLLKAIRSCNLRLYTNKDIKYTASKQSRMHKKHRKRVQSNYSRGELERSKQVHVSFSSIFFFLYIL